MRTFLWRVPRRGNVGKTTAWAHPTNSQAPVGRLTCRGRWARHMQRALAGPDRFTRSYLRSRGRTLYPSNARPTLRTHEPQACSRAAESRVPLRRNEDQEVGVGADDSLIGLEVVRLSNIGVILNHVLDVEDLVGLLLRD